MARIGLCGGSYTSQSVNAEAQFTMNLYPEQIETGQGKSAMALYPTPGTNIFCTLTDSPVRAMITTQGRAFAIAGVTLFEIFTNGTFVSRGGAMSPAGGPASITAGTTQLLMSSGGGAWAFNLGTLAFASVTGAGLSTGVNKVGYSDGFFIALYNSSGLGALNNAIQVSALLDATTWSATAISTQNVFADDLLMMVVDHREIWFFGRTRSLVYQDIGAFPFPFAVVASGTIEQGIIAANSAVQLDNSIFWIGGDQRGNGVGWRANGYTPVRVSNHAVELAWSQYSTIADAIGYSYQDQGHSFWVIDFPTANHTWVYDVAIGMWHERGFWNGSAFTAHKSAYHMNIFGQHLVGDPQSGNIYSMSINTFTDGNSIPPISGNPIRRIRRAPHISTENEWIFHHQLQLDMETGLGTGPAIPQSTGLGSWLLQDASLAIWGITVDDSAILHSTAAAGTPSAPIFINDSVLASTSWQVGVNTTGLLTLTSVAFNSTYPTGIAMNSNPSQYNIGIFVSNGLFQTSRGPQVFLRWSDDGGHTWSNYHAVDVGNVGQFRTRAMWRRLGRSRDRVYEISAQDAIPYRFLEEDLIATPGFVPSERITKQYQKVT